MNFVWATSAQEPLTHRSFEQTIRKIDFQNFSYFPFCHERNRVRVKGGEYDNKKTELSFGVLDVYYGDLDGDKQEEAVVLTSCNTGGTGIFTEGYIYKMKKGKPVLIFRIPVGDRAHGGLLDISIEDQMLSIVREATSDGACCTETYLTQKYRLTGNQLIPQGDGTRETEKGEDISIHPLTLQTGKPMILKETLRDGGVEYVFMMKEGQKLEAKLLSGGNSVLACYDLEGMFPLNLGDSSNQCFLTAEKTGKYRVLIYNPPDSERSKNASLHLKIE